MCLVAAFDSDHRKLVLSTNVECLALEDLNLRDNLVGLNSGVLARLDRDVLALAYDLNGTLVTVEELEGDTLVDLIGVIETDGFVSEVLENPLVTTELSHGLCGRFFASNCCFGRCRLSCSGNLLLFSRGCFLCAYSFIRVSGSHLHRFDHS